MTVKFRDPVGAKACVIVSPPFHRCMPSFIPNSLQTCRRCKAGSSPAVEWKRTPTQVNNSSNAPKEKTTTCLETAQIRNENVSMILPSG